MTRLITPYRKLPRALPRAATETGSRRVVHRSRCEGVIGLPFVAIFAERLHPGLGVPVGDGQQNANRFVGSVASSLPLQKCSHIQIESGCEILSTQPEPLVEGDNQAGGGSSTILRGNSVSPWTWARISPSAVSMSRPSSVRSRLIVQLSSTAAASRS